MADLIEQQQRLLQRLGYVDYNDPFRCIKLGCRSAPAVQARPCECIALCVKCLDAYKDITTLKSYCPICLLPNVSFGAITAPVKPAVSSRTPLASATTMDKPQCRKCFDTAVVRISKSSNNPGKPFWACPNRCPNNTWIKWKQ